MPSNKDQQRTAADPFTLDTIEAEIQRIQSLGIESVRDLWGKIFRRAMPQSLTRDLLVRMITWQIQEQAFGGYHRSTIKLLDSYAKGKTASAQKKRRLKPGSEIVREYQGERHTVIVSTGGYRWKDREYSSLTAIAREITGTNWNGPRFFGLREPKPND